MHLSASVHRRVRCPLCVFCFSLGSCFFLPSSPVPPFACCGICSIDPQYGDGIDKTKMQLHIYRLNKATKTVFIFDVSSKKICINKPVINVCVEITRVCFCVPYFFMLIIILFCSAHSATYRAGCDFQLKPISICIDDFYFFNNCNKQRQARTCTDMQLLVTLHAVFFFMHKLLNFKQALHEHSLNAE